MENKKTQDEFILPPFYTLDLSLNLTHLITNITNRIQGQKRVDSFYHRGMHLFISSLFDFPHYIL